ncbi:MAG: AMP-binding protein [Gammaproteobacteria bacterium]|nr:AMP-binding protein [Gammaproteobacteria bacterium]
MQKHYDNMPPQRGLNYVPLSPLSFLRRAADTYPEHPSVVYGERRYTWRETAERCRKLRAALRALGVAKGDTVSLLAANTPELIEAHYGVPQSGGVLNAINTRLDADTIAYILEHGDCRVLITDSQFSQVAARALSQLAKKPRIIDIVDAQAPPADGGGERLGEMTYEELLASAPEPADEDNDDDGLPESEWDALALNYTSGTGGRPKGVVYHHRGAYLMCMGTVAAWEIPKHPRYLYTVPMFHCNGWGHVWTMTLMGGTLFCNRAVRAEVIFDALARDRITHFGGAPVILAMLADAPREAQKKPERTVQVMTAGAPPPSKVLEKVEKLGLNVTHVYGLTETYGHVMYCDWQSRWDEFEIGKRAEHKARQGVRLPMMEAARVHAPESGAPVPADGETLGEIVLRGNTTMKGYYKNPDATAEAFGGGWFHSGDLAVVHADGYIEVKDRLKDVIISGGENISSIEVESVLYKHPKVAAAAVVAKPDEKWGETPCAFIELQDGQRADAAEIIQFCREHLSGFKSPKHVVFGQLPKTSTGKIQKFKLRELARKDAPATAS